MIWGENRYRVWGGNVSNVRLPDSVALVSWAEGELLLGLDWTAGDGADEKERCWKVHFGRVQMKRAVLKRAVLESANEKSGFGESGFRVYIRGTCRYSSRIHLTVLLISNWGLIHLFSLTCWKEGRNLIMVLLLRQGSGVNEMGCIASLPTGGEEAVGWGDLGDLQSPPQVTGHFSTAYLNRTNASSWCSIKNPKCKKPQKWKSYNGRHNLYLHHQIAVEGKPIMENYLHAVQIIDSAQL